MMNGCAGLPETTLFTLVISVLFPSCDPVSFKVMEKGSFSGQTGNGYHSGQGEKRLFTGNENEKITGFSMICFPDK